MMAKVITKNNEESGPEEQAIFLNGWETYDNQTAVIPFEKGLSKGTYLVTVRAEYPSELARDLRKLVLGLHSPVDCTLTNLDPNQFGYDRWGQMCDSLAARMEFRENYKAPDTFGL